MANPDERCAVCDTARDQHGDKNHQFDADNPVPRKIKPPELAPGANQSVKAAPIVTPQMSNDAFVELVEVLTEKNILDAKDLIRIFSARR